MPDAVAHFETAVPIGTITVVDTNDACVTTDVVRVPGGWVLRTFIRADEHDDGFFGVAQNFVPLPIDTGERG